MRQNRTIVRQMTITLLYLRRFIMNILLSTLHTINQAIGISDHRVDDTEALHEYIERLIVKIIKKPDKRVFSLASETSEVISQVYKLISFDDIEADRVAVGKLTTIIANRLARVENASKEKYQQLPNELQTGSLVQSLIEIDGNLIYLLSKVDKENFLNESTLQNDSGYPDKNPFYKTAMFIFSSKDLVDIKVSDSLSKISRYWWNDFLELKMNFLDKDNTKNAYAYIKSEIFKHTKKSPIDKEMLLNRLNTYFDANDGFKLDDCIDGLLMNFEPDSNTVDTEKLLVLKQHPPTAFDGSFDIIKGEISKLLKKRPLIVNDSIDIIIKRHIDERHRSEIIESYIDENTQDKYIRISATDEETFNAFLKK